MPPSLTPYSLVGLDNIQFQSFRHASKFLQHFRATEDVRTYFLHWPESTHINAVVTLPLRMKRKRPLRSVWAIGCTHNARICVQMASLDPNFAIWKLGSIMTSPTVIPQTILEMYDAGRAAFDGPGVTNNICILKSEGSSMVISIETSKATFTLSVQPRFIQNNGPEQPTFVQHHDQCAPISVVVKCPLPSVKLEDVRNADISTLWKAVFHGFKPAAMTLAAEHDHYFQAFLGQYRELLNEEIEELGQIGGTVRFACKREDMEVVEGSSQSVERWYVVDGRTMQLADEKWDRPEDFDFGDSSSIFQPE